jgi:hypothetical protein
MSEPEETTPNLRHPTDDDDQPDATGQAASGGSDVGGPAGGIESTAEDALSGTAPSDDDERGQAATQI